MITLKSQATTLKKLREQVNALKRKERAAQKKLQMALLKVKKIATLYEKKLIKKARDVEIRVAAVVYSKLAKSLKQQARKKQTKRRLKNK